VRGARGGERKRENCARGTSGARPYPYPRILNKGDGIQIVRNSPGEVTLVDAQRAANEEGVGGGKRA